MIHADNNIIFYFMLLANNQYIALIFRTKKKKEFGVNRNNIYLCNPIIGNKIIIK